MAEFKDTEITPDVEEFLKEISADNEKEYFTELKKKHKKYLIENLTPIEKERIAEYIMRQIEDSEPENQEICDKIDNNDQVYRMERKEVLGSDGSMPNYRTPLTTVTCDVIHAQIMNVFFTPKNLIRVLPTEENDIEKINKLDTFANWSAGNELEIFTKMDRLFDSSGKNGECPYLVHWVKRYGTEVKRKILTNPANPSEPLIDPETKEPLFQEVEEAKLLYNAPELEIFSRKDYFQPRGAVMGVVPNWEARRIRVNFNDYLTEMLSGKMYANTISQILDWQGADIDGNMIDYDMNVIPTQHYEKEFYQWYGKLRINTVKEAKEDEMVELEEIEDEFIALVEPKSKTLCQLRYNKFPLKQRPIGIDYFMPDSEGRRKGIGIVEIMDSLQKSNDALYNQFLLATIQSNNPVIFMEPTGQNRQETIKIQHGYIYPTVNAGTVKIFQFPPPNQALKDMMGLVDRWSQLMFGISDFSAGAESQIDPTAPARKVEILVARGNVRQNVLVKRKHRTIQDIMKRWFLLYKDNMPDNKFMRITGQTDNIFKFSKVSLQDFALNSIPDFELVGNILNSNKQLDVNKKISIYQLMRQDPFFSPQTRMGMQAHLSLTKWLIDGLDEMGLSSFLPSSPGQMVHTPEEENARFLQGDTGEPTPEEDHMQHMKVHMDFANNTTLPDAIRQAIIEHVEKHVHLIQSMMVIQQQAMQKGIPPQGQQQGGANAQLQGVNTGAGEPTAGVLPGTPDSMGGYQ
jgi:hypothetical protein